jgi:hypothetical protein
MYDQTLGKNLTIMIDQKAGYIPPVKDAVSEYVHIWAIKPLRSSSVLRPRQDVDSMDRGEFNMIST